MTRWERAWQTSLDLFGDAGHLIPIQGGPDPRPPSPSTFMVASVPEKQWGEHLQRLKHPAWHSTKSQRCFLPGHSMWWVNCRQMWAEGDWGMKRNLYALNEKDENKCTSQESCRCWTTLVNNQCPYGGKMQNPQRLPLWWSPPGHPHSGSLGWLKLEFFFFFLIFLYLFGCTGS